MVFMVMDDFKTKIRLLKLEFFYNLRFKVKNIVIDFSLI